jgi:hypothetical protein
MMALLKEYLFEGTIDGRTAKMRVFAQNQSCVTAEIKKQTGARSVTVNRIKEV